jgi:hypothetical protein
MEADVLKNFTKLFRKVEEQEVKPAGDKGINSELRFWKSLVRLNVVDEH